MATVLTISACHTQCNIVISPYNVMSSMCLHLDNIHLDIVLHLVNPLVV